MQKDAHDGHISELADVQVANDDTCAHATSTIQSAVISSSTAERTAKSRKFTHSTEEQRLCLLEWLEHRDNFHLMTSPAALPSNSNSGSTTSGANCKRRKKSDGYRSLMHHMNTQTHSNWTVTTARSRYESFLATYRKTKQLVGQSDFQVTDSDRARGITTVEQKRNAMCLYFDRIDALFTTDCQNTGAGAISEHLTNKNDEEVKSNGQRTDTINVATSDACSDTNKTKRIKCHHKVLLSTQDPPLPSETGSDAAFAQLSTAMQLNFLRLEREKLALQRNQLLLRQRGLEIREFQVRAEAIKSLVEAGKTPDEVRAYMALLEQNPSTDLPCSSFITK